MGRYYDGDISGKFWFAVQVSNAASRFGGEESEVSEEGYIDYTFTKDNFNVADLNHLIILAKDCYDVIIDKDNWSENDFEDTKGTNIYSSETMADLFLGLKIYTCIENIGYCEFEAEC